MQTVIQVFATGSGSLRDRIVRDRYLEDYNLHVAAHKKQTRPHGWAKLRMDGGHGAINIEWHGSSRMLICRVVTRGGRPAEITGLFVEFLLDRFGRQIAGIHIMPSRR